MFLVYLAQSPPEVAVTCGHYVAAVSPHALADAVICIGAAVHAGQALYSLVLQQMTGFRTNRFESDLRNSSLCGHGWRFTQDPY